MESFLIFKNTHKKEGTKQPDYNVTVVEDGKFVNWGAGWIKDGKNGKYISCRKNKDATKYPAVPTDSNR